jgi:protein-disulfide isomerase
MNKILKENAPIVIIGTITIIVFAAIILLGNQNFEKEAELVQIEESEIVTDYSYFLGNEDAPFVLVNFSDYECPFCKAAAPITKGLVEEFPEELKLVYRNFPLSQHPYAYEAALAAMAAGEQNKFWEYHDLIFDNQESLSEESFEQFAQELQLDLTKFNEDRNSSTLDNYVKQDIRDGSRFGVQGTPTFYLNGKKLTFTALMDLDRQIRYEITTYLEAKEEKYQAFNLQELDATKGIPEIRFESDEFLLEGQSIETLNLAPGQKFKIYNNTPEEITIKQTARVYEELFEDITIRSGTEFEFRTYLPNTFVLEEAETGDRLEISTIPIPDPEPTNQTE